MTHATTEKKIKGSNRHNFGIRLYPRIGHLQGLSASLERRLLYLALGHPGSAAGGAGGVWDVATNQSSIF